MAATLTFFPVDNGDMTLIETESGKTILIDCNIRSGNGYPDVNSQLRERLKRDDEGRLCLDLFLWTHPDEDHCKGISEKFHLGKPEDWSEDKDLIFIRGLWSSPRVFQRANSKDNKLTEDAKSLNKEAKRRVNLYKETKKMADGNYVQILCHDDGDKTIDIPEIVLDLDAATSTINGVDQDDFALRLLGPAPRNETEEEEGKLCKNNSSVIFNLTLYADGKAQTANFLNGGDAEVVCWEVLWDRLDDAGNTDWLSYDILQAPHHCSWRSISHESWSKAQEEGRTAETSDKALDALGQANEDAFIIASSKAIDPNDQDPPSDAAKKEYEKILKDVSGTFKCVADHKKEKENVPLVIEVSKENKIMIRSATKLFEGRTRPKKAVNRDGSGTYA